MNNFEMTGRILVDKLVGEYQQSSWRRDVTYGSWPLSDKVREANNNRENVLKVIFQENKTHGNPAYSPLLRTAASVAGGIAMAMRVPERSVDRSKGQPIMVFNAAVLAVTSLGLRNMCLQGDFEVEVKITTNNSESDDAPDTSDEDDSDYPQLTDAPDTPDKGGSSLGWPYDGTALMENNTDDFLPPDDQSSPISNN